MPVVQGNCSEPFPQEIVDKLSGSDLLPQKPGQCLVAFFGNAIEITSENAHKLWIDGMYFRQHPMEDPPNSESTILSIDRSTFGAPLDTAPSVWMTNVTMQGTEENNARCLRVSARVAAAGKNLPVPLGLSCYQKRATVVISPFANAYSTLAN